MEVLYNSTLKVEGKQKIVTLTITWRLQQKFQKQLFAKLNKNLLKFKDTMTP